MDLKELKEKALATHKAMAQLAGVAPEALSCAYVLGIEGSGVLTIPPIETDRMAVVADLFDEDNSSLYLVQVENGIVEGVDYLRYDGTGVEHKDLLKNTSQYRSTPKD